MILDLGCGGNLHEGAIGVDIVGKPHTAAEIVCNLGFEPIPVEDDIVDLILCHHFIEHIPGVVNYREDGKWHKYSPLVYLFNEMYRVLKNRGKVMVKVPMWPKVQSFQDPTHLPPFWTIETPYYFSGDYYSFRDVYGHTSRFEMIKKQIDKDGWCLEFEFLAIKDVPDNTPFVYLTYDEVAAANPFSCSDCGETTVYWNKHNQAVQCHHCGALIYKPLEYEI